MSNVLCFTIRFLDPQPRFHGRADGEEPEWPPSPLRLFQALVDAAASHWRARQFDDYPRRGLEWLERLATPTIIAPAHHFGVAVRIAVPNNDLDVWAGPLSRGLAPKKQPNELKTMKTVRPTHMLGDNAVHYLFPLPNDGCPHFDVLQAAARSITHLGWGVDMVAGNAAVLTDEATLLLPGEHWRPTDGPSSNCLRVPQPGTLDNLLAKHAAFLNRLSKDGFRPVPPLSTFRVVGYRRATDRVAPRFAAFSILRPDASGVRAFSSCRRTRDVAGMLRHAVEQQAHRMRPFGWSDADINVFVHGKSPDGASPASGERSPDRFSYLPLPTINHKLKRVEAIRRVLVTAPAQSQAAIGWVQRALSGEELMNEAGMSEGLLTILPSSDWVLQQYVRRSTVWTTVTPVILPRHDGYEPDQAGDHIRMAFEQAGFGRQLVEQLMLEWRRVGYRAGVDLVSRYLPPDNLSHKPRYHVRVQFPHPISGPVAVGSGRFRGFGLFASDE